MRTSALSATASPSEIAKSLGESPANYPGPEPRAQKVADFVGPVAGGSPLWAGFYATYDAATIAYSAPDAPWTEQGWRIKILFLVEPDQNTPVELEGTSVDESAAPVTFDVDDATSGATANLRSAFSTRHQRRVARIPDLCVLPVGRLLSVHGDVG